MNRKSASAPARPKIKIVIASILASWATGSALAADVPTLTDLRAVPVSGLADGAAMHTSGYDTPTDQGGASYIWSSTAASTDDGCLTIKPTSASGTGRWLLQLPYGSDIPAIACGVKPNFNFDDNSGFDNSTRLQNAIDIAKTLADQGKSKRLRLPAGKMLTGPLKITGQIEIVGPGSEASVIVLKENSTEAAITINPTGPNYTTGGYPNENIVLKDFRITGQVGARGDKRQHGIEIKYTNGNPTAWVRAERVTVFNMPGTGLFSAASGGYAHFSYSLFKGNQVGGIDLNSTSDYRFDHCDLDQNHEFGLRSSSDADLVINNAQQYGSIVGMIFYNSDIKLFAGQVGANKQDGVQHYSEAGKLGSVIWSGGPAFGLNSTDSPGTYSDISTSGTGQPLVLYSPRFQDQTQALGGKVKRNIWFNDATARVELYDARFGIYRYSNTTINQAISSADQIEGFVYDGSKISQYSKPFVTYTPTMSTGLTAGSTTFVAGPTSGRYQLVGHRLDVSVKGTINTAGNGLYYVSLSLPSGLVPAADGVISGFASNGKLLSGQLVTGQGAIYLRFFDSSNPALNGLTITATGSFEVQ